MLGPLVRPERRAGLRGRIQRRCYFDLVQPVQPEEQAGVAPMPEPPRVSRPAPSKKMLFAHFALVRLLVDVDVLDGDV